MRHPTTGLSEDDLSRLTGSSSSLTASCGNASSLTGTPTSSSSPSSTPSSPSVSSSAPLSPNLTVAHNLDAQKELIEQQQQQQQQHQHGHQRQHNFNTKDAKFKLIGSLKDQTPQRFSSTYLPEIINPSEWQKSRKRKERLDSIPSAQQDRKLQRSNSEELLTPELTAERCALAPPAKTAGSEVIRRVSSEDFKRTASYASYEREIEQELASEKAAQTQAQTAAEAASDENDASVANRQWHQSLPFNGNGNGNGDVINDLKYRMRYETSPARSQRHSPVRAHGPHRQVNNGNGRHRDSDDSECEHERRRSSERSCKSRLSQGRKMAGGTNRRGARYNAVAGFGVRRGSADGEDQQPPSKYDLSTRGFADYNDNNLIDFNQHNKRSATNDAGLAGDEAGGKAEVANGPNGVEAVTAINASRQPPTKRKTIYHTAITSVQESLPWERPGASEEPAPVLSQRYAYMHHRPADNIDAAAKLSKALPYPQQLHKQATTARMLADDMDCLETLDSLRAFSSLDNLRRRDVVQQLLPVMNSFRTPEERLRLLNKRKAALKRKLMLLEESLESQLGYRPSQAEKLHDKHIKNVLAELSQLRKERQELKADPIGALGVLKTSSCGVDPVKKLEKMKSTIIEIEQNLAMKRKDGNRSLTLEDLSADQLLQEKTAVQHGLLAFESLYGRPMTKEERDIVRPLYERYRQLKRLVARIVTASGSTACATELPTIHEHVAMVFETSSLHFSPNNSSDTSNSPSDTGLATGPNAAASSDDSSTTTTTATITNKVEDGSNEPPNATAPIYENLNELCLERLWEQLERERGGKDQLKQVIREYETTFEEQNGRKMLKQDRKCLEETYVQYKEKKAKVRLLQALIKKKRRT